MNYCPLATSKEYIYVLKRIGELNVIGNLNNEKAFSKFLKKYIGNLSTRGYIITEICWIIDDEKIIKGNIKLIVEELEKIIRRISELKDGIFNNFKIKELKDELEIMIKFVKK